MIDYIPLVRSWEVRCRGNMAIGQGLHTELEFVEILPNELTENGVSM